MIELRIAQGKNEIHTALLLITNKNKPDFSNFGFSKSEVQVAEKLQEAKKPIISFYGEKQNRYIQFAEDKGQKYLLLEAARKAGATLSNELKSLKYTEIQLQTDSEDAEIVLAYAEGLILAYYNFDKYKKDAKETALKTIHISHIGIDEKMLSEGQNVIDGTIIARDLVNAPFSHLNAEDLGEAVREVGKNAGFKTEVLNQTQLETLRFGGLLSVNAGSIDPATFSIMEYKPKGAVNKQPIMLVGKGVVYDTGGLTIKPTPGSMDSMKCDMAGGAAVIGAMHAIAKSNLPVYVVGLIPATDNRPGERAVAPGDVITMFDGTTVEVLNADAEGRLILGDALAYAKKYNPMLAIDLATLTGAAARAIGQQGIVYMGTASEEIKNNLEESGRQTYERLVEFPMWDEYGEMIKSDIADLKNVASGQSSGAITAGKFLEHFTDYPWLHLDIAGPAFITGQDSYRSKNATGVGVRLLFHYIKNFCS
ncbi:MAG: leucyl aminopeptidase family protein [Sphingobacteriales bacterium]|nr:MAG: leucyl aminopeptidase family protein [Sphingobacteriales bacterium]